MKRIEDLTAKNESIETPENFKGELYTPQKVMLAAMIKLEDSPIVSNTECEEWQPLMQTRMARISEKFSFGKTVLSLALVCARKDSCIGANAPMIHPTLSCIGRRKTNTNLACVPLSGYNHNGVGFIPEISTIYSKYIPITIVVAVSNIITQWEQNTERFTNLRYFTIDNVHSLKKFEQLYRVNNLKDFDMILIKAGKVTSNFVVAGESAGAVNKNRSIIGAIISILEGAYISRLIIDDYDTLLLGKTDCFIPASFTWLISATRRTTNIKVPLVTGISDHQYDRPTTVEEFFELNLLSSFPILGSALDDITNEIFSFRCAPQFVDEFINSTKVNFRRILVKGGAINNLLKSLDVSNEVIEMLNAGAIKTATQSLNMHADTAGEVIRRIVGDRLKDLRDVIRLIGRINTVIERIAALPPLAAPPSPAHSALLRVADFATDEEFNAALDSYVTAGNVSHVYFVESKERAIMRRSGYEVLLNRMKDNIREKSCQCCMVPFEDGDDAYILSECCQIIICESCIIKSRKLIDKCPNCAHILTLKGLIRIGSELNIEEVLSNDELVVSAAESLPVANYNPKLTALTQYIRSIAMDCISSTYVSPYVTGLLDGARNTPWPDDVPKKFLIFTMYPESTHTIANELDCLGISYCIMQGSRHQKDECIRRFQTDVNVMLLTSAKNCAGLNLPFVSHIVFYHNVIDKNVEAQVAARGQRIGRLYNLEIATISNPDELSTYPERA
jgi:hypothetical protein